MHNICLLRGDEIDLDAINEIEVNNYQDAASLERAGIAKRDLICERLPMRNVLRILYSFVINMLFGQQEI